MKGERVLSVCVVYHGGSGSRCVIKGVVVLFFGIGFKGDTQALLALTATSIRQLMLH